MKASHTAKVSASPEQVWTVLADHEGMSDWGPLVKVTVDKPSAAVPGGIGTVRRVSAPGPAPDLVEEITEFEPGKRLAYKGLQGIPLKNYRATIDLRPLPTGTEITWTLQADSKLPGVALKPVAVGLLTALVRRVKRSA